MTRDEYVEFLKSTALDIGQRVVFAALATELPFLNLPVVSQFSNFLIGVVLKYAIKKTEFGAFFLYVDIRVDRQGSDFEKAALAWYNATTIEKTKLEADYLEKFYKLASLKS